MTKLNIAPEHYHDPSPSLPGHPVREVDWHVPEDIAMVDLIELYLEIDAALAGDGGMAIQFLAAGAGPGASEIALDMAWAASSVLGKRILVVNCTRQPWTPWAQPHTDPAMEGVVRALARQTELLKIPDQDMYMADLRNWPGRGINPARTDEIASHLDGFRRHFDMVIAVAPPADSEPLGAILSAHVDGNILVIEAEQTRRSAAIRLRELLVRCNRPILGAVLHDRQNHVPGWMAKLL
ncbi:hypothetical protein [Niveispirillum sp.]|uniref:hypothetical protein n=1 Tax=Niveispirillum sp. TaxID=1917217 RepID=UPI001B5EEBA7|nr:hypothetical protein [Niveispirillum sp.]MBP7339006.1 hypothetical protein [Niveispirillum sp.]